VSKLSQKCEASISTDHGHREQQQHKDKQEFCSLFDGHQMGSSSSKPSYSTNDYELAIKSSKELEYLLENEFNAQGKGLHEKISSASSHISPKLVKHMRYLATIRNKLVHERGFDAIPDRKSFIRNFEESVKELQEIVAKRRGPASGTQKCIIS
jgi:hypothetical protein